jgi:hypothetical protein
MSQSHSVALAPSPAIGTEVLNPRDALVWLDRTTCTIPAEA